MGEHDNDVRERLIAVETSLETVLDAISEVRQQITDANKLGTQVLLITDKLDQIRETLRGSVEKFDTEITDVKQQVQTTTNRFNVAEAKIAGTLDGLKLALALVSFLFATVLGIISYLVQDKLNRYDQAVSKIQFLELQIQRLDNSRQKQGG